jgi:ectoine hydroxylase-related dioxygenase (phytanoyl-CoA dioxygenase family)
MDEEVEAFDRDGFVTLRDVLSPAWLTSLEEAFRRVLCSPHVRDVTLETMPLFGAASDARADRGRFYVCYNGARYEPVLRDFALAGALGRIAASLVGSASVRLCDDVVLVKEPHCDEPTEWHDDEPYSIATGQQRCSIWVPLDEVTENSGALLYLKGSHRRFSGWRGRYDAATLAAEHACDVVTCPAWPGDVVVHYPGTIHSAGPNFTARPRRAFAPRFAGEATSFVLPRLRGEPRSMYGLEDGAPLSGPLFPLAWPLGNA